MSLFCPEFTLEFQILPVITMSGYTVINPKSWNRFRKSPTYFHCLIIVFIWFTFWKRIPCTNLSKGEIILLVVEKIEKWGHNSLRDQRSSHYDNHLYTVKK